MQPVYARRSLATEHIAGGQKGVFAATRGQAFPIRHALRDELSWTHYRMLIKVENPDARAYYVDECAKGNWLKLKSIADLGFTLYGGTALALQLNHRIQNYLKL